MQRAALEILERTKSYPVLVVDKPGYIGEALAQELKNDFLVVLVSQKIPKSSENVVHIPYLKKFPTIPDNTYSNIFVIDEEASLPKEILNAFVKKAKASSIPVVFVFNKNYINTEAINSIRSLYDKIKIAVTGDIFAKDYIYNPYTIVNKFILQAKAKGKVLVPGDGTRGVLPIFLNDVTHCLLEILFGQDNKGNIFYLFPKHRVAVITLAHMFIKKNPQLHLDFSKDEVLQQDNFVPSREGIFILGESYNLEERIKKIELDKIKSEDIPIKPQKTNLSKPGFGAWSFAVFFISILLLPLISTLIFAFIGGVAIYSAKDSLEKGSLKPLAPPVFLASKSFEIAKDSSMILTQEVNLIGQGSLVSGIINQINFGADISTAAISLIDASNKLEGVLKGNSSNPGTDFIASTVDIKNSLYIYDSVKEKNLIPTDIINKLSDIINLTSSTVDLWPDILGFNGQKTYLVLFQNNMELRPGGGFIGSYGILTISYGKIKSFNIYDVYDADGQLKTHIEPPFPIRRYLPSAHWYLRDSNFDVDFSKGAVASAVFLNAEMHQPVDGVIAVDLSFIKDLLQVLGPVNVIDYNQTVNSDNFFQITQNEVEDNYFPGSTQKKDFLRSFYNSLSLKISQDKNIPYLSLLEALSNSIYEKHVLFAFNNQGEQAVFSVDGWSSSLIDTRVLSSTTINDFIGISEANLGVDKVNYYISRSLSQNVTLGPDGSISEQATIAFKNSAPKNAWTGGLYKNYLRIILPLGSSLTSININGQDQKIVPAITDPSIYEKKGFTAPQGLEVDRQDQENKTLYGFLVNILPGDLMTIKLSYVLPQKIDLTDPEITYDDKIFKQPGVDFFPYDLKFDFPPNLKMDNRSNDVALTNQSAVLSSQITRDKEVIVNLSQQ